ncbi:MAG: substrate-binding domain-containing protein [Candidatus Eremiobacteraeota bacterium]|nr:substrate-binding domain-containing protein [Candidatus Eremiobacteraeota bacterium]MBV9408049.1 substrate-binding domain-containing protein [Candidatus Eremiobacteraeota bacterium]
MKRFQQTTRLLAVVALPAVLFAACSHGAGSSAVPGGSINAPSGQTRHTKEISSADLHAGGATFPGIIYMGGAGNQPVGAYTATQTLPSASSLFGTAPTTGNIYYCLTGSGFGKNEFDGATSNSTTACAAAGLSPAGFGSHNALLDFIGSDAALTPSNYTAYSSNRKSGHGEPFEFPVVAGAVSFAYNKSDFTIPTNQQMKLSTTTFCKIADGTITDWNDAAITTDNGGSITGGVSKPISNFFYRSDGSGTSLIFQTALAAQCGSNWTFGAGTTWKGPTTSEFVGKSGNPGIASAIAATPASTGYIEAAYGLSLTPHLGQAQLTNSSGNFESPTSATALAAAVSGVTSSNITFGGADNGDGTGFGESLGTSRTECVFYLSPALFNNPSAAGAYPIVGPSYFDFYTTNNVHTADVEELVKFITGHDSTARPTPPIGYTYVDSSITDAVWTQQSGSNPCITS